MNRKIIPGSKASASGPHVPVVLDVRYETRSGHVCGTLAGEFIGRRYLEQFLSQLRVLGARVEVLEGAEPPPYMTAAALEAVITQINYVLTTLRTSDLGKAAGLIEAAERDLQDFLVVLRKREEEQQHGR